MTDVDGNKLESREATFATALPDGTYASWQGAQWIGSQRMYFDASVTNYFSLDATLTAASLEGWASTTKNPAGRNSCSHLW